MRGLDPTFGSPLRQRTFRCQRTKPARTANGHPGAPGWAAPLTLPRTWGLDNHRLVGRILNPSDGWVCRSACSPAGEPPQRGIERDPRAAHTTADASSDATRLIGRPPREPAHDSTTRRRSFIITARIVYRCALMVKNVGWDALVTRSSLISQCTGR
jgi:hypothetical protein